MQHVAADRHGQAFESPDAAADGQGIEQRLGRVLVLAVAGVDDRAGHLARQQLGRTRGLVAHDQQVGLHGVEGHRGVDQRLALRHREELATDMFTTSAPSRLPASSKELWVRVEASKNRLIWVRPRQHRMLLVGLPVELT